MAEEKIRAAVAQMDVLPGDVDGNLTRHFEFVRRARAEGANVLVFPELSLMGYRIGSRGWEIGIPVDGKPIRELAEAAEEMWVVVGFVEEGYAAQFFNSVAVLRRGEVAHLHRKLNLATYGDMEEGKFFSTGRYVETFPLVDPFVGSTLICSDMWNPALVHLAALHGTTLLLAPTNSSLDAISGDHSKPGHWDIFLRHYATIYGLPIAFANRVGSEDGFTFWGGSRIFDAFGNIVAEPGEEGECLLVADLRFDDVRRARYQLPTVRDSNLSLIQREINRLADRLGVPEGVRKI